MDSFWCCEQQVIANTFLTYKGKGRIKKVIRTDFACMSWYFLPRMAAVSNLGTHFWQATTSEFVARRKKDRACNSAERIAIGVNPSFVQLSMILDNWKPAVWCISMQCTSTIKYLSEKSQWQQAINSLLHYENVLSRPSIFFFFKYSISFAIPNPNFNINITFSNNNKSKLISKIS